MTVYFERCKLGGMAFQVNPRSSVSDFYIIGHYDVDGNFLPSIFVAYPDLFTIREHTRHGYEGIVLPDRVAVELLRAYSLQETSTWCQCDQCAIDRSE